MLRKNFWEFVIRTLVQPFLLCFVFLYVFPKIGQGVGGGHGPAAESAFATVLVPGVVGISIMFQGIQAVAMQMAQEFGFTREIEDRVQAPCPIWLVAVSKVLSGSVQGLISAAIVLPIASVVHAEGVEAHISPALVDHRHRGAAGLRGHELTGPPARHLLRAPQHRPHVRLRGAARSPSSAAPTTSGPGLAPVQLGSWHWLQTLVLINPLIYVNEGMRAAFTDAAHMHLYIIYPVLVGFCALFLGLGLRNFRRPRPVLIDPMGSPGRTMDR